MIKIVRGQLRMRFWLLALLLLIGGGMLLADFMATYHLHPVKSPTASTRPNS